MIFITIFVNLLMATTFEDMSFRDLKLTLQQYDAFDDDFKQALNSNAPVDVIVELRFGSTVPATTTARMMCQKIGSDVCVALNANCNREDTNFVYIGKDFPSPSDTYYCAQFMYDVNPQDRETIKGLISLASDGTMGALSCNGEVHALQYEEPQNVECKVESNAGSWGLRYMDVKDKTTHTYFNNDGRRAVAYVLDTGVRVHNDFGNRLKGGKDFTNSGKSPEYDDGNGHGTHVAGTVGGTKYGVAKAVDIYAGKVLSDSGSGTFRGVIEGIEWAWKRAKANNENAVINMSLGGGKSTTVNNAVNEAVREGVSVVVAAGNDNGDACNKSPASAELAITVGSFQQSQMARSGFSNYGECVNVFGPGSSIKSAWITGSDSSRTLSGTSMASPHVAGVVATILSRSTSNPPTPSEISALIETGAYGKSNQLKTPLPGRDTPNRIVQSPCLSSDVPTPTMTPTMTPTLNPTDSDPPTLNPTSNPTLFDDTTLPKCVIVEKSPKFWKFANGIYQLLGPETTTPEGQRVYKNNDTGEKARYLYWTVKNGKGYWFIDDDYNTDDTLLAYFNSPAAAELPVSSGKYWAKKEWREYKQSSIKATDCTCRSISKWTEETCQEKCNGNGNSCHKGCRNKCGEGCSCNEDLFEMEETSADQQSCEMYSSESICPEFACQCS